MADEDPRATGHVCGVTVVVGGTEWICIRAPHDTAKQRSSQPDRRGYLPGSERHYFVNRWPNREEQVV